MPGQPFQRGNNKASKLTGEQVVEIRERYANERGLSQPMLAREYGVGVNAIAKILNGTSWQWLLRGQEGQVYRPPVHARARQIPQSEIEASQARLAAMLDEGPKPATARPPSLYNDPPPTEIEDQAAGLIGIARLNAELDGQGPTRQQDLRDELDKLEKGD